jgi:hypothetical protein
MKKQQTELFTLCLDKTKKKPGTTGIPGSKLLSYTAAKALATMKLKRFP